MKKEQFINKAKEIHGDEYDYSLVPEKVLTSQDVILICKQHNKFKKKVQNHLYGGKSGCKKCLNEKKQIIFINKCKKIFLNKYDYSKVKLISCNKKIEIVCPIHDSYKILAFAHLKNKQGCGECFKWLRVGVDCGKSIEEFKSSSIKRFNYCQKDRDLKILKHQYFYKQKIDLKCTYCSTEFKEYCKNSFTVKAKRVLCPSCNLKPSRLKTFKSSQNGKKTRLSQEDFLKRSVAVHKSRYDYSESQYVSIASKVKIKCEKHGFFYQSPREHWSGSGCQSCAKYARSEKEILWLNILKIPEELRQYKIYYKDKKYYKVDGFSKDLNTVFEFFGDYWHGNPKVYNQDGVNSSNKKTFGELFLETKERINNLKDCGYNVVYIWEEDFDKIFINSS